MSDTSTRKIQRPGGNGPDSAFLANVRVTIVQISGGAAGSEHELTQKRVTLGRDDSADLTFDDSAMSREHAVIEFAEGGFRIRDLGSTNGTLLNGDDVKSKGLTHRDRIQLGEHVFQFVLEERERQPRTYVIPDA